MIIEFKSWIIEKTTYDNKYLYFLVACLTFNMIAWCLTVYCLSTEPDKFVECVAGTKVAFDTVGFFISGVIGKILIVFVCLAIPYIFNERETFGWKSGIFLSVFTMSLFVDAASDIDVFLNLGIVSPIVVATANTTLNSVGLGKAWSC